MTRTTKPKTIRSSLLQSGPQLRQQLSRPPPHSISIIPYPHHPVIPLTLLLTDHELSTCYFENPSPPPFFTSAPLSISHRPRKPPGAGSCATHTRIDVHVHILDLFSFSALFSTRLKYPAIQLPNQNCHTSFAMSLPPHGALRLLSSPASSPWSPWWPSMPNQEVSLGSQTAIAFCAGAVHFPIRSFDPLIKSCFLIPLLRLGVRTSITCIDYTHRTGLLFSISTFHGIRGSPHSSPSCSSLVGSPTSYNGFRSTASCWNFVLFRCTLPSRNHTLPQDTSALTYRKILKARGHVGIGSPARSGVEDFLSFFRMASSFVKSISSTFNQRHLPPLPFFSAFSFMIFEKRSSPTAINPPYQHEFGRPPK